MAYDLTTIEKSITFVNNGDEKTYNFPASTIVDVAIRKIATENGLGTIVVKNADDIEVTAAEAQKTLEETGDLKVYPKDAGAGV